MDKWLTVKGAAEYLSLSKETIYRLTKRNSIPYCRVGKLLRFNIKELDKWVLERSGTPIKVYNVDPETGVMEEV